MKRASELMGRKYSEGWLRRIRNDDHVFDSEDVEGVVIPNTTQIPNEILDHLSVDLTCAEYRVLMYIIRKTFGYQKRKGDYISLGQIVNGTKITKGKRKGEYQDRGAGVSRPSASKAIAFLEKAKLIKVVRNKDKKRKTSNHYRLSI